VSRAVEQLRHFLSKRGIAVGATSLAAVLSANAVQSAPIGLSSTISAAVSLSGAAAHSVTIGATKTILMTTMQKTLIAAAFAGAIGTGFYEALEVSQLRNRVESLQQQQKPLREQLDQMRQERDAASSSLTAANQDNETLRREAADLPKLRNELARLREDARELARLRASLSAPDEDPTSLKAWARRAAQLKQRLDQMPDKKIPELQLLTDQNWFDAVKDAKQLETEDDFRQALGKLRTNAKAEFALQFEKALLAYIGATGGVLPNDLSQLKPYFSTTIDDAIFGRYTLLQIGRLSDVPEHQYLVAETAPPVDDEYDTVQEMSLNGLDTHSVSRTEDAIKQAGLQFAQAHNGLLPTDASQLAPYLRQAIDPAKVQKLISEIPPGMATLEQLRATGLISR